MHQLLPWVPEIFRKFDPVLAGKLASKAKDAWEFALTDPGVTQTACTVSPYFYEEDNWVDDLELAAWEMFSLTGRLILPGTG